MMNLIIAGGHLQRKKSKKEGKKGEKNDGK
nr:MAG TPA: hypothetical protein [Caudoviricetes sp.]